MARSRNRVKAEAKIIDFLQHLPELVAEQDRKSLLYYAGLEDLQPDITVDGTPRRFAVQLVQVCANHGSLMDVQSPLEKLLLAVMKQLGPQERVRLEELLSRWKAAVLQVSIDNKTLEDTRLGCRVEELQHPIPPSSPPPSAKPPVRRPRGFKNRERQIDQLVHFLARPEPIVLNVHGPEGSGRKTLVRETLWRLPKHVAGTAVYYSVSSRDDCETIGRQVYDRIVPGRNTVPSEGTMLAELRNEQRLILLSNLDYPGAEIGRLLELAPSCSWVFTSRKPKSSIPDVHPVPLSGLPESEALQVFEDRLDAQRLQLYDQDDIRLICRELRYLPGPIITKALSDNLSQIAPEATRKALARSLLDQVTDGFRSDDAKARRSLIDSARPVAGMLDKNECILAAYLAQFGSTKALEIVPHEFVQYALAASNLPPSVLMSLLKRGTLTEHSPRYSLDPALAMLAREEWVDKTIKDTVAEYFCDLAVKVQFRDDYLERYETRFLDARDWLYKRRMWKKVILIVQALDRWLLVTGQWTQWEIGLKQAINAAKRIHRHSRRKADYQTATWATKVEAWALLQLGGKEYALRNPDSARNLWKTALELRQKSGEHEGVRLVRENLNALPSARKHGFRSPVTLVAGYILAFVVLTVVVLAFGGAIGLVAYVLTLSTAVLGVYWIIGLLKKKRMLYSIPGDHVAVIERDGTTPREVIGPLNQNWRNPLTERIRAIVPMHELTCTLHNLQITTSKNSKLRTTLQVRYRVTKPIAATYSLVGAGEQTMRDGVLTESELRAAWEAHIGNQAQELLTEYSWDRMPKPDRESIQAFLATTFSRRAAQMGLEIQQVNVLEFDYYQRKKQS